MSPKGSQQKLSFDLKCRYYATQHEIAQCLLSLWKYLLLERHQKKLPEWELFAKRFAPGQNADNTLKIVMFEMRFTHKWLTVENMSGARRVFLDTMRVLKEIMGGLAKASPAERGDLEWSKVFSYGCHPRNVCGCKGGWGIEPAGYYCHPREQGGANGSAQKAIQELLIKYMEMPEPLYKMKVTSVSSARTLQEARRRVDNAYDNTLPLWNSLFFSSIIASSPLQLDVDLVVFTMKKVVRWYDELLTLFKVAVQEEGDIATRVNRAVYLSQSLCPELDKKQAEADDMSVASDSEMTLYGEKDWGLGKVTVVEVEDVGKLARLGVQDKKHCKMAWWKKVLGSIGIRVGVSRRDQQRAAAARLRDRSLEMRRAHEELRNSIVEFAAQVDQLRRLARAFILQVKLQTKWRQVHEMAQRPGVEMVEINKVTTVNIAQLSCHRRRAKAVGDAVSKIDKADCAMVSDAESILGRGKKLQRDVKAFYKDHKRYCNRYSGKA